MTQMDDVVFKKFKTKRTKDYVKVAFRPNFKNSIENSLSDDMLYLFWKRVYDIAGIFGKYVKVYLDDELIKINSFWIY